MQFILWSNIRHALSWAYACSIPGPSGSILMKDLIRKILGRNYVKIHDWRHLRTDAARKCSYRGMERSPGEKKSHRWTALKRKTEQEHRAIILINDTMSESVLQTETFTNNEGGRGSQHITPHSTYTIGGVVQCDLLCVRSTVLASASFTSLQLGHGILLPLP